MAKPKEKMNLMERIKAGQKTVTEQELRQEGFKNMGFTHKLRIFGYDRDRLLVENIDHKYRIYITYRI